MSDDPGRDVAIFTEALRLPRAERAAFLEQACAGDEDLRRKVLALLAAHERLGDFLEKPPFEEGTGGGMNGEND
jgi:serine/threonine-protein kinase